MLIFSLETRRGHRADQRANDAAYTTATRHVIVAWVGVGRGSARRATGTRDFSDWRLTGAYESEGRPAERERAPREPTEIHALPIPAEPRSYRCTVLRSTKNCRGQQTRRRKHQSIFRDGTFARVGNGLVGSRDRRSHLSSHARAGKGCARSLCVFFAPFFRGSHQCFLRRHNFVIPPASERR